MPHEIIKKNEGVGIEDKMSNNSCKEGLITICRSFNEFFSFAFHID